MSPLPSLSINERMSVKSCLTLLFVSPLSYISPSSPSVLKYRAFYLYLIERRGKERGDIGAHALACPLTAKTQLCQPVSIFFFKP